MKRVFADTHFYIALFNEADSSHALAMASLAPGRVDQFITTGWVLLETANAMSRSRQRAQCGRFIQMLQSQENTQVVPLSNELQERGLKLFTDRADKAWSLTDCISFVVMTDEGLKEALTGDHHFEQAGFMALLA